MTPERAYSYCTRIAAETYDDIYALPDDAAPEEVVEIVLAAAKRLGLTDADTPTLIAAWPKTMARMRKGPTPHHLALSCARLRIPYSGKSIPLEKDQLSALFA